MPTRKSWIAVGLGLGFLPLASCSGGPVPPPGAKSVVLVTLDTTRPDFFSGYGFPRASTPSFDELADEGTLFELAISTAAVTPVSHASILTGRNPYDHHLRVLSAAGGYRLPGDVPTLCTLLKRNGWSTTAVHSAFPVSGHFGFDRDFDRFESFDAAIEKRDDRHRWDVDRYQRRSDETTELAIEAIRAAPEPFFLWIHYWDPHDVKRLPPEEFLAGEPVGREGWTQQSRERYAAEVHWVDRQFGRLVQALKEAGRYADTLFAVTADHGEGLGEHAWNGHRLLYQEQIHVPLILRLPGVPGGRRVPDLVRTIDVMPTLLDYLGLSLPEPVEGRSLRPLIEGRPDEPRLAYADQINGYDKNANILRLRPLDDFLYCVMDARWKLIYVPSHPERSQLYDLASDPDEVLDLFHRPAARAERRRLLRELARREAWVTAPFLPDADIDPEAAEEARRALEKLGYTGGADDPPPAEDRWCWACIEHDHTRAAEPGACPTCGEPLLLRAR